MATQAERRAQTREALLDAAATTFAAHGVAGATVEAIAKAAGRTSGAVYDHFGGKEGVLFALLEDYIDRVATVIVAELVNATTLDERLLAMWRNVSAASDPRWIDLEHALWAHAARDERARATLQVRYRRLWDGIEEAVAEWTGRPAPDGCGPTLIALQLGLEMLRRIDPGAVTDDVVVRALRAAITTDQGAHA